MKIKTNDLDLISPRALAGILRDEPRDPIAAADRNTKLTRKRLWSYYHDHRIYDVLTAMGRTDLLPRRAA